MRKIIKPNTFLIGVQKSATTSVYDWISQHHEVCGPIALKDYPFFLEDEKYNRGIETLQDAFIEEGYTEKNKIVLQGNVQYIFHKKALQRIHKFDSEAKLIVVLRNPVDRALSAFQFFKKLNKETLTLNEALKAEERRMKGDLQTINDLTYKAHGLYSKQLKNVFDLFDPKQVLVLFYEDIINKPEDLIKKTYKFLGIDTEYVPQFKKLNVTGTFKHPWIHKMFFKDNKIRKFFVDHVVDVFLPQHKRTNIRLKVRDWNTSNESHSDSKLLYADEIEGLRNYYEKDILELEKLIHLNLDHWRN